MGNTLLQPASGSDASSSESGPGEIPTPSTTRPWYGKLFGVLLLVAAFAAGWVLSSGGHGQHEKEGLPPQEGTPERAAGTMVVTVEPVARQPVQRTIEVVGSLHGFEEVTISARVEGRVQRLRHDVADRVQPGEVLLEIDPTDRELAVRQAERSLQVELAKLGLTVPPEGGVDLSKVPSVMLAQTRLDNAQARHERVMRLGRAISVEEADTALSDYRAAQAEQAHQLLQARAGLAMVQARQVDLALAKQQLADTKVIVPTPTLPVPGTNGSVHYAITQRLASEGALMKVGTEVFKLVINDTLKLRVPVPERHEGEVQLGQKVDVYTAASAAPVSGTVTRINPATDPTTRTFEVEIQVPNGKGNLKPGNFAKAAIRTRLDPQAATVPLTALVQFAGITKIFVMEQGKAREIPVTPGLQTTDWIEIAEPALPAGTVVITSGQTNLANDTPVVIRGERGQK